MVQCQYVVRIIGQPWFFFCPITCYPNWINALDLHRIVLKWSLFLYPRARSACVAPV